MGKQNRRMPSIKQIVAHWAPWLVERGYADSVADAEETWCFACGFDTGDLQKAHIKPRCEGGSDTVDNLHILCSVCHKCSEHLEGDAYFKWLHVWTWSDRATYLATKAGFPVQAVMASLKNPDRLKELLAPWFPEDQIADLLRCSERLVRKEQ